MNKTGKQKDVKIYNRQRKLRRKREKQGINVLLEMYLCVQTTIYVGGKLIPSTYCSRFYSWIQIFVLAN